jgi:hypothetical protein
MVAHPETILVAMQRSGYRGKRRNEPRRYSPRQTEMTTMLNLGRLNSVKYGLREIMAHYKVDEPVARTVIASVIAKGSRISIASARDYVREQEKAGVVSHDVSSEICMLLDQHSKLR